MSNVKSLSLLILLASLCIAEARGQVSTAILKVLDNASGRRLAVFQDGRELGSMPIPAALSSSAVDEGIEKMLRHPKGNALAAGFKSEKGSFVVVFLRQASGSYIGVDVSQVEKVNIGAIGPNRAYRNVETEPAGWLERPPDDDAVQVWLRTRAWDLSGQRYTMKEPLIITRDGKPLWR